VVSGVQLYGTTSGYVYDSLVYKAYGGIQDLARTSTRGVASEGYGWFGETGSGSNAAGERISFGRMNGVDTNVNQADFSMMPPTPGSPNGSPFVPGTPMNFSTVPPELIQSF